ncbi:inositol monophosphatase [Candidatus Peregrinibacteria bacterium]|nr:inositol monophosphatase [Candidatus Peregrinibacteria bacterium]
MIDKAEKLVTDLILHCGKILIDEWDEVEIKNIKGTLNFATNLDLKIENFIIETLQKHFPHSNILAEESGWLNKNSDITWIIDPVDGTTNYQKRLPLFNTTIALKKDSEIVLGFTYSPVSHELFSARKNKGAYHIKTNAHHEKISKKSMKVSEEKNLKNSRLYTELPRLHKPEDKEKGELMLALSENVFYMRSYGSAALGLAYTAFGAFEGYCDLSRTGKIWDIAAGSLLIQEAGGIVTDISGGKFIVDKSKIVATNGHIHKELIHIINP